MSVIVLPDGAVTFTVSVIVIRWPLLSGVTSIQVTTPVLPGLGAVQVPAVVDTLLNVVPAGTVSVMMVSGSTSGPLLVATIV